MSAHDVHLLVLVHGMWGNPGHLAEMKRIIQDTKGQEVAVQLDVLVAQANMGESTYDGIDWGGERIADEVRALLHTLTPPIFDVGRQKG